MTSLLSRDKERTQEELARRPASDLDSGHRQRVGGCREDVGSPSSRPALASGSGEAVLGLGTHAGRVLPSSSVGSCPRPAITRTIAKWPRQQKFNVSQFWRLEVHSQDVCRDFISEPGAQRPTADTHRHHQLSSKESCGPVGPLPAHCPFPGKSLLRVEKTLFYFHHQHPQPPHPKLHEQKNGERKRGDIWSRVLVSVPWEVEGEVIPEPYPPPSTPEGESGRGTKVESCSIPAVPGHPAGPGLSGPCSIVVKATLADAETMTWALREQQSRACGKEGSVGS
ncbi:uncharacterized protein LOC120621928 [Pteropus medius]|uniref:uncharacterized protein LOC120621928 n=1 Tax=Pteropus vampyrus TaxID=132908 RepID=UPI00196A6DEE|nr:uncharacterized protein LOC120621928 [Pteropus giganteus]